MKIMLVGSMAFVKDMVDLQKQLVKFGHDVSLPRGSEPHLKDSSFVDSLAKNLEFCIENNVMKENFDQVAQSNAILVVNKNRNGIDGYIGVSALMEMAVAHHLNKKIFVYNEVPHFNKVRWAHEVAIIQPIIIKGDLKKIK